MESVPERVMRALASIDGTKTVIRERRVELRADERVTLRKNASDWLEVRCSATDIGFVVDLVARAADAHRPAPGEPATRAPCGGERERRRRFH